MKYLLLSLFLTGCATRVYENGHLVMETYGDSSNFEFTKQGGSVTLRATRLNHSKPTQTAFDGTGKVITAGGAAAALFAP